MYPAVVEQKRVFNLWGEVTTAEVQGRAQETTEGL